MKVELTYGKCSMFVEGLDMNCPLCGKLVKSGENHSCSKLDSQAPVRQLEGGRGGTQKKATRERKGHKPKEVKS